MFPKMRKNKRETSKEEALQILERGSEGILGTISYTGYPYTTPVNYILFENKIYFHCADEGHKLENIKHNNKVSFTVITKNKILESIFSTDFESVIVFGKARLIEPSKDILMELIKKYSPNFTTEGRQYVEKSYLNTQLVEIEIDHITGKRR